MTNRTGTVIHMQKCELGCELASNVNLKATKFLEENREKHLCNLASEKISHLEHQNSNPKEPIDTLELMKTFKFYSSKEQKKKATDREKAFQSINVKRDLHSEHI